MEERYTEVERYSEEERCAQVKRYTEVERYTEEERKMGRERKRPKVLKTVASTSSPFLQRSLIEFGFSTTLLSPWATGRLQWKWLFAFFQLFSATKGKLKARESFPINGEVMIKVKKQALGFSIGSEDIVKNPIDHFIISSFSTKLTIPFKCLKTYN